MYRLNTRSMVRPPGPLLLLLLLLILPVKTMALDTDQLLVVNGLGEYLTVIDRAGDSIIHNAKSLGLAPNRIRLASDAILVVNSVSDDLWILDPDSYATQGTIIFPDGDNPWDVLAIDDSLAAVSMLLANYIALVNYKTSDTLTRIPVGKSPEGLLQVDGNLWVANSGLDFGTFLYDPGTISVVDPSSGASVTTIPVGTNPQVLARAGDGTVHVLCTGDYWSQFGIVYVIDASPMSVTDSIPLGGSPGDLAISHDGTAYVAAGGWVDSGLVFVYDANTRTVLHDAGNPWRSAKGVTAVAPRAEGGVFALCFDGDSVVAHDAGGQITEAYQVGDGPQAVLHVSNRVPGDLDGNGAPDSVDLGLEVDVVFFGGAIPGHPASGDLDGDCFIDSIDLAILIDLVYFGSNNYYWGCAQ